MEYSFSPFLKEKLYYPDIYASISIQSMKAFVSVHALALYENCIRYRPNEKANFRGETGKWTIEEFRSLVGANTKCYEAFKYLKKQVLSPAVKEINDHSNIKVKPELIKTGRKYTHIKFYIENNTELSLLDSAEVEKIEEVTETEAYRELKSYNVPEVQILHFISEYGQEYILEQVRHVRAKEGEGKITDSATRYLVKAIIKGGMAQKSEIEQTLIRHGISSKAASCFTKEHSEEYLNEKIEILEFNQGKKQIKDPGAWLANAIKNDYQPPADFKTKAQREEEKKKAEARKQARLEKKKKAEEAKAKQEAETAARLQAWEEEKERLLNSLPSEEQERIISAAERKAKVDMRKSKGPFYETARKSNIEKILISEHGLAPVPV